MDTITTDPKHSYKKVLSTIYTHKIIIDTCKQQLLQPQVQARLNPLINIYVSTQN